MCNAKTKVEEFVQANNVTIEITVDRNGTRVYIFRDDDVNVYSYRDSTLNGAIENAVGAYIKRNKYLEGE